MRWVASCPDASSGPVDRNAARIERDRVTLHSRSAWVPPMLAKGLARTADSSAWIDRPQASRYHRRSTIRFLDRHMRQDKLTTKFQEALADAQSIAVGHDHQYIVPVHVLAAMLRPKTMRGARSLLQRAGVNVASLNTGGRRSDQAPAAGPGDGRSGADRARTDRASQRRPTRKRRNAATASSPARCSCSRLPTTRPNRSHRARSTA